LATSINDGQRFLAQWGEQAEALGWTVRDLFGLAPVPGFPHPSYRRLSRYDETQVLELAETTAVVESQTGATVYRRHNKPAFGPIGDGLEDLS
jgi:hypothetical protein